MTPKPLLTPLSHHMVSPYGQCHSATPTYGSHDLCCAYTFLLSRTPLRLLIHFKREFPFDEVLRLWEALWTAPATPHLHLYMCCAVLMHHRRAILHEVGTIHHCSLGACRLSFFACRTRGPSCVGGVRAQVRTQRHSSHRLLRPWWPEGALYLSVSRHAAERQTHCTALRLGRSLCTSVVVSQLLLLHALALKLPSMILYSFSWLPECESRSCTNDQQVHDMDTCMRFCLSLSGRLELSSLLQLAALLAQRAGVAGSECCEKLPVRCQLAPTAHTAVEVGGEVQLDD